MLRLAKSERKTLMEVAQQEHRLAIPREIFRPGNQLQTEAALCEMLGVSRIVVRETVRLLNNAQ